jgi:hypothetical protein
VVSARGAPGRCLTGQRGVYGGWNADRRAARSHRTTASRQAGSLVRPQCRPPQKAPETALFSLAAEERPLELPRLGRRESRLREHFHHLVRELPLFWRERWWVPLPTQTGPNVRVDPRALTRHLIREPMQIPDLIEKRLKLFVANRHGRPGIRPLLGESFPMSLPVLVARGVVRESVARIVEGQDCDAVGEQRTNRD